MEKGLTVPKWVLINWPKILQMPQNLSAQIVCPSPNVWDFDEKRLHWASVVRGLPNVGDENSTARNATARTSLFIFNYLFCLCCVLGITHILRIQVPSF
jgi:hypothetical protein